MAIIKNNELLKRFENDASVWVHSRAVPPLVIKGGTPEKPYTTNQMTELIKLLASRTPASIMFTKGDVSFEELKTIASDLNLKWWLDYLLLRRYQSLGVPALLMGKVESGTQSIAEVSMHDFIARLQVLQEFVADSIEEFIFRPLITAKFGKSEKNAEIVWKPIIEEDKNMRSQRLIQMQQAGAISINELREEMGFNRMNETKYDELREPEPFTNPSGFPEKKPGQPGGLPPKGPNPDLNRTNKPPESRMKMEQYTRNKKFELMKLEETFRNKMLGLTQTVKFELHDDAKLVKAVKEEALKKAKNIINEYVVASYLSGRLRANTAIKKKDDLSLNKNDMKAVAKLKVDSFNAFEKIVDDMIIAKGNGTL